MANALSRLVDAIPPPENPQDASGDWSTVESRLKLWLPSDYRRFIEVYGAGIFLPSELCVYNFLASQVDTHFIIAQNEFACDDAGTLFSDYQENEPVFPWGADRVGSEFFLETN